jgi:hypothetical protein
MEYTKAAITGSVVGGVVGIATCIALCIVVCAGCYKLRMSRRRELRVFSKRELSGKRKRELMVSSTPPEPTTGVDTTIRAHVNINYNPQIQVTEQENTTGKAQKEDNNSEPHLSQTISVEEVGYDTIGHVIPQPSTIYHVPQTTDNEVGYDKIQDLTEGEAPKEGNSSGHTEYSDPEKMVTPQGGMQNTCHSSNSEGRLNDRLNSVAHKQEGITQREEPTSSQVATEETANNTSVKEEVIYSQPDKSKKLSRLKSLPHSSDRELLYAQPNKTRHESKTVHLSTPSTVTYSNMT